MTARTSAAVMAGLVLLSLLALPIASAAPAVTAVTPNTGPVSGGTNVVITGTGFDPASTVTIGGTAMTGVVVNSPTEIVATTPAKTAGTYNLVVTNPDTTTYTFANAFTFAQTPTITTLSPASGPTAGGTVVTVTGTNMRAGATLTVGGTAFTGVTRNSDTELIATSPAKAAGCYNVVVTNTDGSAYTKANGFCYGDQPTIATVTPSTVGTGGGASVEVTGTNFRAGATLTVGGTAFTGVTVNSATNLVATAPAKAEGTYNVVVTVDGLSYAKANALTYVPVANPTIASITPNGGPVAGGTVVTIVGTGFKTGATVTVGGTAATGVTFIDSTTLQATTPAKTAGSYNVVVTNTDGGSKTVLNGFTYAAAPTVTSLNPTSGTVAGGTTVTITGTGFTATVTGVTFDGVPATGVVRNSATKITAVTPAHPAGSVSVVVTNSDGQTGAGTWSYGLPGEEGFQQVDTYLPSAQAASGKWPGSDKVGETIVMAYGVGAGNQPVVSVSHDDGVTWEETVLAAGEANSDGFRVAMLNEDEWIVQYVDHDCFGDCVRQARTADSGNSYVYSDVQDAGSACSANGPIQHDIKAKDNGYVVAIASTGFSGSCNTNGLHVRVSSDGGLTFGGATYLINGARCGSTGAASMTQTVAIALLQPTTTTWTITAGVEACPTAGSGRSLCMYRTTNSGVGYGPPPGYGTNCINDPFKPSYTSFGREVAVSDDASVLVFRDESADGSNVVVALRSSSGIYQFADTAKDTVAGSRMSVVGSADSYFYGSWLSSGTTNWFTTIYSADGQFGGSQLTDFAGNNGGLTYRSQTVLDSCPSFDVGFQGQTSTTATLVRTTKSDTDCGAGGGSFIEQATDGLRGFDMSPGGLDTTIIVREDDGMVRSYDPTTLAMRAEADSRCNDRADGVAALYPDVNYLFCDAGDSFDVDGFRVKNFFLETDPLICTDGCATSGEDPGVISEEGDVFIDTPEGMGQIGWSSKYPWTFENRFAVAGQTFSPLVFPFTIAGTGQFGIYAIELREDDIDPDGFELEQFAPNGQTISQMCTWRTETNGRDLIGVVHPTAGLRLYSFSIGDFTTGLDAVLPPSDIDDISITPYMTAPGSSAEAVGISCAGDVVMYATADSAAAPGKVVAFYADGPKKGQKLFEKPDVDPVNRGVALSAGLKYGAYTDFAHGDTDIHYVCVLAATAECGNGTAAGTELVTVSIDDRELYQMALDRPGGILVVANSPGGSAPAGSLIRFDFTSVAGGCELNCTDTVADPFDTSCGTGCGEEDPTTPGGDADEKVGLLQVKARTGLYLTGVALLVFLAIGYRFTAGNRQREPKEEDA